MSRARGVATARAARPAVTGLGGAFMISAEARTAGKDGGFRGRELYVVGRAGVLGDGPGDAAAAAIGFFEPGLVRSAWDAGRAKAPVADTVERYTEVCRDWGRRHYADLDGADRLAGLLERVAGAGEPAGWVLFAGWRARPLPDDAPARVAQLLHVLREHRGGAHLSAVRLAGLTPLEAIVAGPGGGGNATFFGWRDGVPEPDESLKARHAEAETMTDVLVGPAYEVLDDEQSRELLELLAAARLAVDSARTG